MTASVQAPELSPVDRIREKLDDPRVAESLNDLLDHADLLAILVSGLDGMMRRGDTLSDNLTSAIGESKGSGKESSLDLAGLAESFAALSGTLIGATPALSSLLGSRLTDPQAVDVLSQLGGALVEARNATARDSTGPKGLFGILKATKDPDVARGLGFVLQVAKSFGRQLR